MRRLLQLGHVRHLRQFEVLPAVLSNVLNTITLSTVSTVSRVLYISTVSPSRVAPRRPASSAPTTRLDIVSIIREMESRARTGCRGGGEKRFATSGDDRARRIAKLFCTCRKRNLGRKES
jgi:hypothetical protein